jgi:hypothetical protein
VLQKLTTFRPLVSLGTEVSEQTTLVSKPVTMSAP